MMSLKRRVEKFIISENYGKLENYDLIYPVAKKVC